MNITEKKLENATMELQIDVPGENVEDEYKTVFNMLQKNVSIDGFRKGKVPIQLVETRFVDQADREAAENLVKRFFADAVTQKGFTPIAQPQYSYEAIKRGEPFSFKVVFEVPPTVTLGKYRDIAAEERTVEIKPGDIEDEISIVRERDAIVTKKVEGVAQNGDFVKIKVKRLDEKPEGEVPHGEGAFKEYSIIVGKSKDSSALDKYIVGMATGEERDIDVKYPKDYYIKDLADKKAAYRVRVEEINNFELPDLNDEYSQKHSFTTVVEMREKIKDNVNKFVSEKTRGEAKAKILQQIVDSSTFDVPESMIQSEMLLIFKRTQERIGYNIDSIEKFASVFGLNKDEFIQKLRDEAIQSIKTHLTLHEIATKEELKVPEDRFNEVISAIAQRNNKTEEEIVQLLESNNGKPRIENELLLDQAMDFIYNNAKVKKLKGISYEEFMRSIA